MNCEVFGQPPQYRYAHGGWERRGGPGQPWRHAFQLGQLTYDVGRDILEANGVEAENINPTDQ